MHMPNLNLIHHAIFEILSVLFHNKFQDRMEPVFKEKKHTNENFIYFIYLGFNVAFNTVQVISRRVVGRAEETST